MACHENTCFKDVLPIDLSIEVNSYYNEVKPTVIRCTSPHHDWATTESMFQQWYSTRKEILANASTQSYPFAMVPNTSSMEFGLVEESSLVRQNSLLVERVNSYYNEVKPTVIRCTSPHYDWATTESMFQQWYSQHKQCLVVKCVRQY
jgi:aminoglycoside N3'-acetyltransferase